MSEVGVPYKKRSSKARKFRIPPPPDIPAPNPERPPPSGPIPGEPAPSGQTQVFMCPVCGMTFNSKEALQLHIASAHPGGPQASEE